MLSTKSFLLVVVILTVLFSVVQSQGACERLTIDVLGNSTALAGTGLIGIILDPAGDSSAIPDVQILDINIVCESQNIMQDRYAYTSAVVRFICSSTHSSLSSVCDGSTNHTRQFDLGCFTSTNMWTSTILNNADSVQTIDPLATLTTERDSDCRLCINPSHPFATSLNVANDTHCVSK